MKVLVTGAKGQLGSDILKELSRRKIKYIPACREDFDITDVASVDEFIRSNMPDVIVHCAAYTGVDKAEDEPELCEKVNVNGTVNIARICSEIGAKMVYISTDYVFDGGGEEPYETNDKKGPLGVYGNSKLLGEEAVLEIVKKLFIVRISWVFGKSGNNFIKTMLRIGKENIEVKVVCDQIGSPTYTVDLAELLCNMIETDRYGTYHATNEGYCSWAELAEYVFRHAGYSTKVNEIKAAEYHTKAVRPYNSRLSKKSLDENGFQRLPKWDDAVDRYLKELGE